MPQLRQRYGMTIKPIRKSQYVTFLSTTLLAGLAVIGCDKTPILTKAPGVAGMSGKAGAWGTAGTSGMAGTCGTADQSGAGGAGGGKSLAELQMRGQYLVDHVEACGDCHTPHDPATGAPNMAMYLAGNPDFI